GNRFAIGAKVGLLRIGQKTLWRRVNVDGSYLSSSDPRVHFGLGDSSVGLESLIVEWPNGEAETWKNIRIDTIVTLLQGTGERRQ
ncbi:MAG: ASPIC/UnbV domain-containing protein, partial [Bryobacteraceae bacterium]